MTVANRHIVIAGGGMVGISLALRLAQVLPPEVDITLVEGHALPDEKPGAVYHPSFDARSTALSYSTRLVFEELGLWDELAPGLSPIETIHVSSRGRFGSSVMRGADYGWPALGWVGENGWLGRVLAARLAATPRIRLLNPARCTGARVRPDGIEVSLDGDESSPLAADLLVVADGARSALRDALGPGATEKPYGQHALVANIVFAADHDGRAFERFTPSGPLALLPLRPADDGAFRSALVWTLPPDRAGHLATAPEAEFLSALGEVFGYRLGKPLRVGQRDCYPLSLLQARETARRHLVVVGNAAHSLHPVAGQGFNLALRDVFALAQELAIAVRAGDSPGEPAVLARYQARTARDQQRTIAASDLLPELFMRADPLLGLARDLALSGLDIVRGAKREFVRHAAGLAALEAPRG